MKSYITRQFKKFMKNANVKGFDKDQKTIQFFVVQELGQREEGC